MMWTGCSLASNMRKKGEQIVIVASHPSSLAGKTNIMKLHIIGEGLKYAGVMWRIYSPKYVSVSIVRFLFCSLLTKLIFVKREERTYFDYGLRGHMHTCFFKPTPV